MISELKAEKVIIHFGMDKTGSTSIRASLSRRLSDPLFYYLTLGIANASRSLAAGFRETPTNFPYFRNSGLSADELQRLRVESIENLNEELRNAAGRTGVLSAEAVSNFKESEFRNLCDVIGTRANTMMAVGYIRRPKEYMESNLQQQIKGNFRKKKFTVANLFPDYRRRFEKFDSVLGRKKVQLWLFDVSSFPNGCVVQDFCGRLGIQFRPEDTVRTNEALSLAAISLLYAYRKFGPTDVPSPTVVHENRALIRKLRELGGPSLRFHSSLVGPVIEQNRDAIAWMEDRLGSSLAENLSANDPHGIRSESDLQNFSAESLQWLAKQLGPKFARRRNPEMDQQQVAEYMHLLRKKLAGRHEEPVAPRPATRASSHRPAKPAMPSSVGTALSAPPVPFTEWTTLDLDDPRIDWVSKHKRKNREPLGDVFRLGTSHFCRAIHRDKAYIARDLIRKGVLDALVDKQLIPPYEVVDIEHRDYAMLMRAESAPWAIRVPRYPLSALKEAALVWLGINRLLFEHGYGLIDGHYANFVMMRNGAPVWIDVGSIVPLNERPHMCGIGEFIRYFAYPLLVLSRNPNSLGKRGQLLKRGGITSEEATSLAGGDPLDSALTKQEIVSMRSPAKLGRIHTVELLTGVMQSLELRVPKGKWSEYRGVTALDRALRPEPRADEPRNQVVLDLVRKSNPAEILDVGANNGFHSALFAAQGYNVLGIDTDEFAMDSFYSWIRRHPELKIFASVENFSWTAHRADTVVSLALTHHLAISGKIPFEEIAARYAEMARKTLIVEFMPNGLGGLRGARPNPLPEHYGLKNFTNALSKHFRSVSIIDYERPPDRPPRTMICCTDRTAGA